MTLNLQLFYLIQKVLGKKTQFHANSLMHHKVVISYTHPVLRPGVALQYRKRPYM